MINAGYHCQGVLMALDQSQQYLLKALDAFDKRVVVVSPELELLAVAGQDPKVQDGDLVGCKCYKALYRRKQSCKACPARQVINTLSPTIRSRAYWPEKDQEGCLYAFPIPPKGKLEAIAIFHFESSIIAGIETEMRRSHTFLQNLIRNTSDPVIAADMTGRIVIFNEAAAEATGYSVDEALASLNIRDFYVKNFANDVMRDMRSDRFGGRGKLKKYRMNVKGKDGTHIPISLYASIIHEGELEVATIGFFHDLREQIHMQQKLEKTQHQLLQSEKMASLGKLAAGVAHQLNNPLGSITLYAKLILEEYDLEPALKEDLDLILRDARRCRSSVRELLEFARQKGQFTKPMDIIKAVEQCLTLIQNQSMFHNIEIRQQLTGDLPWIAGDSQQLNHVFMNIMINSAQAMEGKGNIDITIGEALTKDRLVVQIKDTGPGIDKEHLKHIFEPFFTTKKEGQGTGLGLSVVYNIIEQHGGTINATSEPGHGAMFTIELPISRNREKGEKNDQRV
jgi:two-component system, NtrC family, sensor kinase